ncbi:TRAP transporter small permease [Loktanella agnita]|uniref:TRAP transporter small permease n=1 Tax=Loktanella agnita TaxID=287097 RepID=UPI003987B004
MNWVFEVCVFLLVWAVLLGIARIEQRAQHIHVDVLYDQFGPKGQMAAELLSLVFAAAVAVHLVFILDRLWRLVTTGESAKQKHSH